MLMYDIYFGAPLFSVSERMQNLVLTEYLEQSGYRVVLPQRDGFQFNMLDSVLSTHVDPLLVEYVKPLLIYLLDLGYFLPQCNAMLARLDEPLDPGVLIEMSYAHHVLHLPVIGYRTDARTPYGSLQEPFMGMHYFPGFCCSHLIREQDSQELMHALLRTLRGLPAKRAEEHTRSERINLRAQQLFTGIAFPIAEETVRVVVARLMQNWNWYTEIYPNFMRA